MCVYVLCVYMCYVCICVMCVYVLCVYMCVCVCVCMCVYVCVYVCVCVCMCVCVCVCVLRLCCVCVVCYSEQCLEAKQVVWITGNEVVITSKDKEDTVHRFGYDHCFSWSPCSKWEEQEDVYRSLAKPLLDRSFEGYNTCLFAYGQVRGVL